MKILKIKKKAFVQWWFSTEKFDYTEEVEAELLKTGECKIVIETSIVEILENQTGYITEDIVANPEEHTFKDGDLTSDFDKIEVVE